MVGFLEGGKRHDGDVDKQGVMLCLASDDMLFDEGLFCPVESEEKRQMSVKTGSGYKDPDKRCSAV